MQRLHCLSRLFAGRSKALGRQGLAPTRISDAQVIDAGTRYYCNNSPGKCGWITLQHRHSTVPKTKTIGIFGLADRTSAAGQEKASSHENTLSLARRLVLATRMIHFTEYVNVIFHTHSVYLEIARTPSALSHVLRNALPMGA